ncbi:hypothetical protein GH714_035778 [Hevea brasiliensis]|uniref:Pentacotripeptide-repeat region of PRORP domain-containing protein n=1 Tax=Hevea brasiliensis TaxID=3981 RepID=A0A6A6KS95_HEVBR|nr:hypothetical protein GH714_035778 [Hevea brasiliensis]
MTNAGILPSFVSLSRLIDCFVHTHELKFAFGVLSLILKRGFVVSSYVMNLMLKGLCRNGEVFKALDLFSEMKRSHVLPDNVSYSTIIKGLCTEKRLENALDLLVEMEGTNFEPDVVTYCNLMDGLCKVGRVEEAKGLLENMKRKGLEANVIVYGVLVGGYCKIGQWKEATDGKTTKAVDLFKLMLGRGEELVL